MEQNYDSSLFIHPFTCVVAGPSKSGKTELLMAILMNNDKFVRPKIENIVYCYSIWQPGFDKLKAIGVKFHEGICDYTQFSRTDNNLVVFDDLMDECSGDRVIQDLFTRGSHHLNISAIVLTQNLFNKGKYSRTISLNSQYLIIFNNPRDRSQIGYLARQMYPESPRFMHDVFRDATSTPHGYLFIDNNQETPNELRLQSSITGIVRVVYTRR